MPRKAKSKAPSGKSRIEAPPKPLELPEGTETEPPRRKVGRPRKEEVEARKEAERAAFALKPEDTREAVGLVLTMFCSIAKGDNPLPEQVESVNRNAVVVANKYDLGGKALPELMLAASVFMVIIDAKRRKVERLKEEKEKQSHAEAGKPGDPGPQRRGKDELVEAVVRAGSSGDSN